jgi:hypothetical protein
MYHAPCRDASCTLSGCITRSSHSTSCILAGVRPRFNPARTKKPPLPKPAAQSAASPAARLPLPSSLRVHRASVRAASSPSAASPAARLHSALFFPERCGTLRQEMRCFLIVETWSLSLSKGHTVNPVASTGSATVCQRKVSSLLIRLFLLCGSIFSSFRQEMRLVWVNFGFA